MSEKEQSRTADPKPLRYILLCVLLVWAVVSLGARYLLKDLSEYQTQIETLVSEKSEFNLTLGSLSGRWLIYSPIIELKDIRLFGPYESVNGNDEDSKQKPPLISVKHVAIELDVLESLLTLSPRIKRLLIDGLELELEKNPETKKIVLKGLANTSTYSDPKALVKDILDQYILSSEQIYLQSIALGLKDVDEKLDKVFLKTLSLDSEWWNHDLAAQVYLFDQSGEPKKVDVGIAFNGNPVDIEDLSARIYIKADSVSWSYWLEKVSLSDKKLQELVLGGKVWAEIESGQLVRLQVQPNFENLIIGNDQDEVLDTVDRISFDALWLGSLELLELNDKNYLKTFLQSEQSLKVSHLNLLWGSREYLPMGFIIDQGQARRVLAPLKRNWNDLRRINFSVLDFDARWEKEVDTIEENASRAMVRRLVLDSFPIELSQKLIPLMPVNTRLVEFVSKAQPEGYLNQVQLINYTSEGAKPEFYISADLLDVGMSSFEKIPGLHGIDAYVEVAPNGIGVELDAADVLLEKHGNLFREDIFIRKGKGHLFAARLPDDFVVQSDLLKVENDWIKAIGFFDLNVPNRFYQDGLKEQPSWSLRINFEPASVTKGLAFFPGRLPKTFLSWLDAFLLEGEVGGDLLLFGFGKKHLPETFMTIGGGLRLNNAELDYLPGKWPKIDDVFAELKVHNDEVKASSVRGKIFDSEISSAEVFIPSFLIENLPRVKLNGEIKGDLKDVRKLFLESELKVSLGHVVEDWVLDGEQTSQLYLDLPISSSSENYPSQLKIDLSVKDASLDVPSIGLGLKNLKSDLEYSLTTGLQAESISAEFFGRPLKGSIKTQKFLDQDVIQIQGNGFIESADLRAWQNFWLFNNLEGGSDFEARIAIGEELAVNQLSPLLGASKNIVRSSQTSDPTEELSQDSERYQAKASVVRVDVSSDFNGLVVELPGAYAKPSEISLPSRFQLDVHPESMIYRMAYGDRVGVSAQTSDDGFEKARIHFGKGAFPLPPSKGLMITGFIEEVYFDSWLEYLEKNLFDDEGQSPDSSQVATVDGVYDSASILNHIDITLGNFYGFDQHLKDLKAFVTRQNFAWRAELENSVLAGLVMVPDEDRINKDNPIVAKLDYLKIDPEQMGASSQQGVQQGDGEKSVGKLEEFTPSDFEFLKLDVAKVTLGKEKHGRWQVDFSPDDDGVNFDIHQLNYGLMAVNGKGRWDYSESSSRSRFKGHLRTAAVTRVFSALSLKPSANSGGLMAVDLNWPGSPLDFDPDAMKGTAGLEIFDGSIVEVDISSKKFRALGIFNLGVITDVLTLRIFKKIGKKIEGAFDQDEDSEDD